MSTDPGSPRVEQKSKEEALTACTDQHIALLRCYKDHTAIFGQPCKEQHEAFWACYKDHRRTTKTTVGAAIKEWLASLQSPASRRMEEHSNNAAQARAEQRARDRARGVYPESQQKETPSELQSRDCRSLILQGLHGVSKRTETAVSMQLTQAAVQRLVAQHCPVLMLHHRERYFPCSVEWYLQRCELWALPRDQAEEPRRLLLRQGDVAEHTILQAQQEQAGAQLRLVLASSLARLGVSQADVNQVPLYVLFKRIQRADGSIGALEITYATFYAFNGPYSIGCCPPFCFEAGAHDGDWEHFTVRLDPVTGALVGCYFNAHRPQDGQWLPASHTPLSEEGAPLAYVAKHAHGLYCTPGVHRRAFLVVNDHCSAKGTAWRARQCILMAPVLTVPSRGSCLPRVERRLQRGSWLQRLCRRMGLGWPGGSSKYRDSPRNGLAPVNNSDATSETTTWPASRADSATLREQLVPGPPERAVAVQCEPPAWAQFAGGWGSSPAPMQQSWFGAAEYPQTRPWLQRVLHLWPSSLQDLVD